MSLPNIAYGLSTEKLDSLLLSCTWGTDGAAAVEPSSLSSTASPVDRPAWKSKHSSIVEYVPKIADLSVRVDH